jgi:hypothetical protein
VLTKSQNIGDFRTELSLVFSFFLKKPSGDLWQKVPKSQKIRYFLLLLEFFAMSSILINIALRPKKGLKKRRYRCLKKNIENGDKDFWF